MKNMIRAAIIVTMAMIGISNVASAADVYTPNSQVQDKGDDNFLELKPVKRNPFAGLAIGVHGGGQFNATKLDDGENSFDGISSDGFVGGAQLEYLFSADKFRFGPYLEGGFSNVDTNLNLVGLSAELNQDHYYGLGVKAGVMVTPLTMVFARAGYEWSKYNLTADNTGINFIDEDADVGVWKVGGGVQTMVAPDVSLAVNVDYLMVDDIEAVGEDLTKFLDESEGLRSTLGLSYHF
jgi:outer membrane immunogenic protein